MSYKSRWQYYWNQRISNGTETIVPQKKQCTVKMFCFGLIMVAKTIHIKIIEYVANFFTKRDFSIILPCSNMLKLS